MSLARRGQRWRGAAAALFLIVGLVALLLWRVLSGSSELPYRTDAAPPSSAHVTAGHTYSLAVPGGVRTLLQHGVRVVPSADSTTEVLALRCTYSVNGAGRGALTVTSEATDTKAENTVGHFTAPITGPIHVDCDGWGAMFVPDSDDRPVDWAGWAVVVATVALTVGVALALSALWTSWSRSRASRTAGDDDEVEGTVDVAGPVGEDREVAGGHRGDVTK